MTRLVLAVWRRELARIAGWPGFYVATGLFGVLAALVTLELGDLIALGRADLDPLFAALPWLFCLYLPFLSSGLWAGEARSGAIAFTLSLAQPAWAFALGKWLAAWSAAAAALVVTAPLWITLNVLGAPDNAAIALAYLIHALAAGAILALGSAASAVTRSQTVAYGLAAGAATLLVIAGAPGVQAEIAGALGQGLALIIDFLSLPAHLEAGRRGVLEVSALVYFATTTALYLLWTALALDARRGGAPR